MYDLADYKNHKSHENYGRGESAPGNIPNGAPRGLQRLIGRVERALKSHGGERRVLRLVEPLDPPETPDHPLRWLGTWTSGEKVYWSGREDGRRTAAVGVADLLWSGSVSGFDALGRIRDTLSGSGARYYGGLRFDPGSEPGGEWEPFGTWRFVLPRLELTAGEDGAELACNICLPRDADRTDEVLGVLQEASRSLPAAVRGETQEVGPPLPVSRLDSPDRAGWDLNVRHALSAFGQGGLEKVVLARRAEFRFAGGLAPEPLLANLEAATPGCFHFGLQPAGGVATFVGASPERLYRREGREVASEAVAGTLPRGDSEESDEALREELLASEKLGREQGHVRSGIRESLAGLCEELEAEEGVSEMKLASRRHLVSGVQGRLHEGVTDADVLARMSPTPAVGGYPREAAIRLIRELEPFDRGFYAGPVGWVGADSAEFAVGIRSGLVSGDKLSLYSGNGIVEGSEPEEEWREIEQKISDFAAILGLDPR